MADLPGLRLVRPSDVETMVFDWGTIKWMSEPRVTHTSGFTMGVVLLEPAKDTSATITRVVKRSSTSFPARATR